MPFTIRTATAADVAAMHRIRCSVRENRLSDPRTITEASYLPFTEAGSAWVAETSADVAGFAAVDGARSSVWALFVDPDAEGRGIGRALLNRSLDWAWEHGIARLTLSTEPSSGAMHFYEHSGWTPTGFTQEGEVLFERCCS